MPKKPLGQSGRNIVPSVQMPNYFKNIIENLEKYDIVLLPYECEKNLTIKQCLHNLMANNKKLENIAIIIGPEGGFDPHEIDLVKGLDNVHMVTLGKRVLRTETAGLACLAMLSYELEI